MDPLVHGCVQTGARLPGWALGLSLATHVALLAGPGWQPPGALADPPPLRVRLEMPAVVDAAPAIPAAAPAAEPPPPPRAAPTPPARLAARSPAPKAARSITRQPPPAPVEPLDAAPAPLAVPAPIPTPSRPAPVLAEASPAVVPAAREAVAAPPDPAALARYARQLGDLLAGRQQYPRLAALRGWEGAVTLRLRLTREGGVRGVELLHSSGFDVLDQHALQFVQATVFPPLPADFRVAELSIDIPVVYSLKRS